MYAHTYAYARSSSNTGADPTLPAFLLSIRYKWDRVQKDPGLSPRHEFRIPGRSNAMEPGFQGVPNASGDRRARRANPPQGAARARNAPLVTAAPSATYFGQPAYFGSAF